jgi:uncharacterized membrane protein YcaP (DUF421 family)
MNKPIQLTDFYRIIIGEVPLEFYLELFIRLILLYIVALVAIRMIGQRMAAQLSKNELAALVSIAAAIGVALQAPDKGLLPAVLIVIIIVGISRAVAVRASRNQQFEKISQGNIAILVEDSVFCLSAMNRSKISKERVCAQLRAEQVKQLGEVKRLYLEANGEFSIHKENIAKPGLSIVPDWDEELRKEQEKAEHWHSCSNCGYTKKRAHFEVTCKYCEENKWITAVK